MCTGRLLGAELGLRNTVLQRVWFAPGCGGVGRKARLPELPATFTNGEPASPVNSGSRDGGLDSDFITKGGDTMSGVD